MKHTWRRFSGKSPSSKPPIASYTLKPKKKLTSLYAKIYETPHVTNNEFMSWVVKGYIVGVKGHNSNWAKVDACITREKAQKELTKKLQKTSMKLELSNLSEGKVSCKSKGNVLISKGKYARQGCVSNS